MNQSDDATTADLCTLANARDVGDVVAGVRRGALLRSDAPLEGDLPPAIEAWPPATVVDLRDSVEAVSDHPLADGAALRNLPLLSGSTLTEMPQSLGEVYAGFLLSPLAEILVDVVTEIATGATPVLVHCSAGKDRTGVAVATALALVGIDREAILADYVLTAPAMPNVWQRMQLSVGEFSGGVTLATLPKYLIGAPADALVTYLDALDAAGRDEWFLAHGGEQGTLDLLRARLLES